MVDQSMLIATSNDSEKQGRLEIVLKRLSKNKNQDETEDDVIKEVIGWLECIYECKDNSYFRPSSGTLAGMFLAIHKNNPNGGLEMVSNRLATILTIIKDRTKSDHSPENIRLYKSILGLYDMATLELSRISLVYQEHKNTANDAKNRYEASVTLSVLAQENYNKAIRQSNATKKEITNVKTEVVTILSIFAAIIVVFSGGLTILGESIASLHQNIIYKSAFIVLLCILGIFNSVYLLLYISARITDRTLLVGCQYGECQDGKCTRRRICKRKWKTCSPLKRFARRLPYVFWFNVFILFVMLCDVVAWALRVYPDQVSFYALNLYGFVKTAIISIRDLFR